ncbi:MAG: hypothetical protein CL823_02075 [Crocinitomicaceae bacterium]|nr:hypothetical protein [Crocinitomicaceae bacterium]
MGSGLDFSTIIHYIKATTHLLLTSLIFMAYNVHILRPASLSPGIVEDAFSIIEQNNNGPLNFTLSAYDYEPEAGDLEDMDKHGDIESSALNINLYMPNEMSPALPDYSARDRSRFGLREFIQKWRGKEPSKPLPIGRRLKSVDQVLHECNKVSKRYRQEMGIEGENNLVVVMTTQGNLNNFFAEGADVNTPTAMVQINHTVMQEGNPHLLLAYYMAAMPIKALGFNEVDYIQRYAHYDTRGCMNDLCADNVFQLRIKTKTADICSDCKKILKQKNVPFEYVVQARKTFTTIRDIQNHIEDFENRWTTPGISVGSSVRIPEHGKVVKLSPKEIAVYRLFLCVEEGISYTEISQYKEKLKELYKKYYNRSTNEEIESVVDGLCVIDGEQSNLRQTISRLNSKVKSALGKIHCQAYQIKGGNGERKKISLDRKLVSYKEGWEF